MKRVIVNADDFGWSQAVTDGILQAHTRGIVTSTTLMANLPGAPAALERARREAPDLGVGLHLNLTEGEPLAPREAVSALVSADGRLPGSLAVLLRRVRLSRAARLAAETELDAQFQWARRHGLEPSHADGHKHVHLMPALWPAVVALARRYGVEAIRTTVEFEPPGLGRLLPATWGLRGRLAQALRQRVATRWGRRAQTLVRKAGLATTDWFFGVRATGGMSAAVLEHVLRHAPDGTGEIMVHPGLPEARPDRPTRLAESRPLELEALCDPRVRASAEANGVAWMTYKELADGEPTRGG